MFNNCNIDMEFKERFKGRINVVKKEGLIDILVAKGSTPIDKHCDTSSTINARRTRQMLRNFSF